jgi:hypothetical protein
MSSPSLAEEKQLEKTIEHIVDGVLTRRNKEAILQQNNVNADQVGGLGSPSLDDDDGGGLDSPKSPPLRSADDNSSKPTSTTATTDSNSAGSSSSSSTSTGSPKLTTSLNGSVGKDLESKLARRPDVQQLKDHNIIRDERAAQIKSQALKLQEQLAKRPDAQTLRDLNILKERNDALTKAILR